MVWDVVAILLSLALLITIAYRGLPVIVFAPLCATLAVVLSGASALPNYTESFMAGAASYIKMFFPIFLLGAIFGKLMDASGAAASIASGIVRAMGPRHAIAAIVMACGVLTYGGVSLFVVAFAVYPFGASLFRAANIPKRLLPATIALGAFTFTMDALPGTPQIQNLIPTRFFGTDIYAAPIVGVVGAAIVLAGGLAWLEYRRARALAACEGYGEGHMNEPELEPESRLPRLTLAILPLAVVLATNFILGRSAFSIASWHSEERLRLAFPTLDIRAAAATWGLIVALVAGIGVLLAVHHRRLKGRVTLALTQSTSGALLAIFNTASEVGFGHVIKSLPGFQVIRGWVTGLSGHVLISEAVSVNVLAGMTGSASGGLSIALEVMGTHYLELARTQGVSPELLHRIASMASGGMDTLPHNGAVITLLTIAGLTHRRSYPDIFAITLIKTAAVFALAVASS